MRRMAVTVSCLAGTLSGMSVARPAPDLARMEQECRRVRLEVVRLATIAGVGHYGPSLSAVEILVSLYHGLLDVDGAHPERDDRDRLVLGKGHACSALYPILADLGFLDPALLDRFTRLGSPLGDHPDRR